MRHCDWEMTAKIPDETSPQNTRPLYHITYSLPPIPDCVAWGSRLTHRLTFVLHAIILPCLAWVGWGGVMAGCTTYREGAACLFM